MSKFLKSIVNVSYTFLIGIVSLILILGGIWLVQNIFKYKDYILPIFLIIGMIFCIYWMGYIFREFIKACWKDYKGSR